MLIAKKRAPKESFLGEKTLQDNKKSAGKNRFRQFLTWDKVINSFLILFLLGLSFALGKSVWQTLQSQNRISLEKETRKSLEEEVRNLEAEQAYLQSADFVEQEGRDRLNYLKPGEKIVVLSENTLREIEVKAAERASRKTAVVVLSNWQQWLNFLFDV